MAITSVLYLCHLQGFEVQRLMARLQLASWGKRASEKSRYNAFTCFP